MVPISAQRPPETLIDLRKLGELSLHLEGLRRLRAGNTSPGPRVCGHCLGQTCLFTKHRVDSLSTFLSDSTGPMHRAVACAPMGPFGTTHAKCRTTPNQRQSEDDGGIVHATHMQGPMPRHDNVLGLPNTNSFEVMGEESAAWTRCSLHLHAVDGRRFLEPMALGPGHAVRKGCPRRLSLREGKAAPAKRRPAVPVSPVPRSSSGLTSEEPSEASPGRTSRRSESQCNAAPRGFAPAF